MEYTRKSPPIAIPQSPFGWQFTETDPVAPTAHLRFLQYAAARPYPFRKGLRGAAVTLKKGSDKDKSVGENGTFPVLTFH